MRLTYTHTTTPPAPAEVDLAILDAQVRAIGISGFSGITSDPEGLHFEFPGFNLVIPSGYVDQINALVSAYVYQAPPDGEGAIEWLHANVDDTKAGALLASPYGALLFNDLARGVYDRVQARYDALKAAPPSPNTVDDLTALAQVLSGQFHIPVTP